MLPQGGKNGKMSLHESQESFISNFSSDDQIHLIVTEEPSSKDTEVVNINKESDECKQYFLGPCQNSEGNEMKKGPEVRKKVSDFPSPKINSKFKKNTVSEVYTVRHVKRTTFEYNKPEDTSKTDDEKLIELLSRDKTKMSPEDCDSLKLSVDCETEEEEVLKTKPHTPAEEAAAIARLVTSLPPFIPPKMKNNPCSLSPVLESAPYTPKRNSLSDTWRSNQSFRSFHSLDSPSRSLPTHSEITSAMMKVVDDKQNEVWVHRSEESGSQ